MAWRETIYVQFPNEVAARSLATTLGVDFPEDGRIPTGNQNYAMHAPMEPPSESPDVPESGYWAMLRLNDAFGGYDALVVAIDGAGVRRELANPPVVWAKKP